MFTCIAVLANAHATYATQITEKKMSVRKNIGKVRGRGARRVNMFRSCYSFSCNKETLCSLHACTEHPSRRCPACLLPNSIAQGTASNQNARTQCDGTRFSHGRSSVLAGKSSAAKMKRITIRKSCHQIQIPNDRSAFPLRSHLVSLPKAAGVAYCGLKLRSSYTR